MMDQEPIDSVAPTNKWQFSLRTLFVVTTICAIYLGLVARWPITIRATLIVVSVLLFVLAFISVVFGITALMQFVLLRLRTKAPRLVAWIFGGQNNSRQR